MIAFHTTHSPEAHNTKTFLTESCIQDIKSLLQMQHGLVRRWTSKLFIVPKAENETMPFLKSSDQEIMISFAQWKSPGWEPYFWLYGQYSWLYGNGGRSKIIWQKINNSIRSVFDLNDREDELSRSISIQIDIV